MVALRAMNVCFLYLFARIAPFLSLPNIFVLTDLTVVLACQGCEIDICHYDKHSEGFCQTKPPLRHLPSKFRGLMSHLLVQ